ncbi:allantoinase, mitochondrial-like [Mizuhopecten yessoensis]|uniref:allantoinase n=1 Tax=Mizuhopecten yessoensis TaxID=6573 RepID=A0A210PXM9_MIZYE|nr:allantoinase, mitochondrial-like [Mizuhopecten yessoensis]OWF41243.1 Allantoinase, mitochondrial [Mizuhopecten yessoensis]
MTSTRKAFRGNRVVLDGTVEKACIVVEHGKIVDILKGEAAYDINKDDFCMVVDAGNDVIMPGVVDSHVHVNEPGRTMWEGYWTATEAAAVGGTTTIVDMPLNCIPSTTSCSAFATKLEYAQNKCFVDVGFWGGIVPNNQDELRPMLNAGVLGFKCFLIHSGVDDFPAVTRSDLEVAMEILQDTDAVILFHAEMDCSCGSPTAGEPKEYQTFLDSRPDVMEIEAIKLVCELCLKYRVKCHIVHLSSATALPLIVEAKRQGAPLTVETCHHYLSLEAENVPGGATQYKCCPPIRSKHNQEALWEGIQSGHIDMVVSDHSPCTPDLKELATGDFTTAWGGIASVQFGLSLFWTSCQKYDLTLHDVVRLLCCNTAQLAGLGHRKGAIQTGYDADFVIWDPQASYQVTIGMIRHKNKLTPYEGRQLQGVVKTTVVGGATVYDNNATVRSPRGNMLLRHTEN